MFGFTFKKSKYYNPFLGCPKGFKKQQGYTRKDGRRVPTRCVHSATDSVQRRQEGSGLFSAFRSATPTRKCPKGQVYRKGYTRKFHTKTRVQGYVVQKKDGTRYKIFPKQKAARVKPSCVKEKRELTSLSAHNLETKCKQLERGQMARYNYQYRLPVTARRLAIKRAIQDSSPLKVQKRLALAAKCSAKVKPAASKVFKEDADYIQDTYAIDSLIKK